MNESLLFDVYFYRGVRLVPEMRDVRVLCFIPHASMSHASMLFQVSSGLWSVRRPPLLSVAGLTVSFFHLQDS